MGLDSPDHTKSSPSGSGFFSEACGLAHCPHPVSGFPPETRPYALMNSTGINVRYPSLSRTQRGLGPMSPLCTARDIERAILRPHRRGGIAPGNVEIGGAALLALSR